MASADVLAMSPITGLHSAPTIHELHRSTEAYNILPDDAAQPPVLEEHLANLSSIILAFQVEEKFGIHLVHGHLHLTDGKIMVGKAMSNGAGCWTRPTSMSGLDLSNLHGHIYVLDRHGQFTPYEFREGPPPFMSAADNGFVVALKAYLYAYNLTGLFGLEVLTADSRKKMCELILNDDYGTVMMAEHMVPGTSPLRVTGWSVAEAPGRVRELKGNSVHSALKNGNHKIFLDSKLGPDNIDEVAIVDTLREHQVFN